MSWTVGKGGGIRAHVRSGDAVKPLAAARFWRLLAAAAGRRQGSQGRPRQRCWCGVWLLPHVRRLAASTWLHPAPTHARVRAHTHVCPEPVSLPPTSNEPGSAGIDRCSFPTIPPPPHPGPTPPPSQVVVGALLALGDKSPSHLHVAVERYADALRSVVAAVDAEAAPAPMADAEGGDGAADSGAQQWLEAAAGLGASRGQALIMQVGAPTRSLLIAVCTAVVLVDGCRLLPAACAYGRGTKDDATPLALGHARCSCGGDGRGRCVQPHTPTST